LINVISWNASLIWCEARRVNEVSANIGLESGTQSRIRLLVVDDSPTARQLLVGIFQRDAEIEVVGVAGNGRQAIELANRLRPDVITMDLHLPDIDGYQATKEIMITAPTKIVIVSANAMAREVTAAVRAMRAGALTLLLKPPGPSDAQFDRKAAELISTVKAMAEVKVVRHHYRETLEGVVPERRERMPRTEPLPRRAPVRGVAIAASTGGPPALQKLLADLPYDFPVPILVVQHIGAHFTQSFATWLDSVVPLSVVVASPGAPLGPARVYVAPEERHLGVTASGHSAFLDDGPALDGFRPSATYLFESVARAFGDGGVGLMLTGMGCDGVRGLRTLRAAGGLVIAQNEQSCVVYGMPGAVVAEGLAHRVLPLEAIAPALRTLVKCAAKDYDIR
jgi:two-component system chemotaxis response regulator CheB